MEKEKRTSGTRKGRQHPRKSLDWRKLFIFCFIALVLFTTGFGIGLHAGLRGCVELGSVMLDKIDIHIDKSVIEDLVFKYRNQISGDSHYFPNYKNETH